MQLTGNEDGRCDSENKTIQFNEEVDVVVSIKILYIFNFDLCFYSEKFEKFYET